jgi:hypothetical protein
VTKSSSKYPVFLVTVFQRNLCFLDRSSRKAQLSSFIKIRPVGADLFHADEKTDGQTWRSNFANALKNGKASPWHTHTPIQHLKSHAVEQQSLNQQRNSSQWTSRNPDSCYIHFANHEIINCLPHNAPPPTPQPKTKRPLIWSSTVPVTWRHFRVLKASVLWSRASLRTCWWLSCLSREENTRVCGGCLLFVYDSFNDNVGSSGCNVIRKE